MHIVFCFLDSSPLSGLSASQSGQEKCEDITRCHMSESWHWEQRRCGMSCSYMYLFFWKVFPCVCVAVWLISVEHCTWYWTGILHLQISVAVLICVLYEILSVEYCIEWCVDVWTSNSLLLCLSMYWCVCSLDGRCSTIWQTKATWKCVKSSLNLVRIPIPIPM